MIWEDTPNNETKETLEAMGVKSIVFRPCANQPQTGDYLTVMNQNVENLKRVYR